MPRPEMDGAPEFRIPDSQMTVRIAPHVLAQLAEQPAAVARAFLHAVEGIANSPPPRPEPLRFVENEHPWTAWARERGVEP